ncbi:MAG: hypothetical protein EOO07_37225 [Chitinophagaceae bacterium]|nr:MAG: hypothetical protein EOO07_37225 [Chitinophagaceae bacterium]
MIKAISFLVFTFSNFCFSDEIIASLDLKFVKDTGETAGVICYSEDDADCHEWSTFYLYEAKVKKVFSGELAEKHFTVIYGHHALLKNNHRNVIVSLKKLTDGADARYQIMEFSQKIELVCFRSAESRIFNSELELGGEKLHCAEKEEL